jgi:hypothetical protein
MMQAVKAARSMTAASVTHRHASVPVLVARDYSAPRA